MTTFTVVVESDYTGMGDSRRPTPSHRLNAYCTVSYGYGYTRGSGSVWVEIFGAGRVRVRVASSATGTGRVAEMVDPHTPTRDDRQYRHTERPAIAYSEREREFPFAKNECVMYMYTMSCS